MSNSDLNVREGRETVRRRAPVPKTDCALAQAVEEIGDRWSLLVLREAFFDVVRFEDMRADLEIPRSVLKDRLSKLVARGLLEKRPYKEPGDRQRFCYALTAKGRDLATALIALTRWSEVHVIGRAGPIDVVAETSGRPLRVALVDDTGTVVPAEQAVATLRAPDER
jgi:DNA-binding HxlR family transcriptional regulator